MAESAVSLALQELTPLLTAEVKLLRGIHRELADIKDELESLQGFLKDADRRAATEGIISDGVQTWVKQLRMIAFRIEDVVDKYMIYMPQQQYHLGCAAAFLQKSVHLIKTLKPRRQIATEIRDIKSTILRIKERSERYGFENSFDQGSSSNSSGNQNIKWHDPRMASLFIKEAEVVGFKAPKNELIKLLVGGATGRTIISVVGMGGVGKTTLTKIVFDSKEVTEHFDCRARITVSQSYVIEELLREIMKQFCEMTKEPLLQDFRGMNKESLITQLRDYSQEKRYVVLLDDVWKEEFWDEIELALPNNDKGSRIIITTRKSTVAEFCKKSSLVFVHNLQPLSEDKARELFCKKAFWFDFDGHCPVELEDLSSKIVQKCEGLPLAIVAIGGILSTKEKKIFEWETFYQNIFSELESNSHLNSLNRILALSYEDLSSNLKSCFLHLGMYPEDYRIFCPTLMMQWIAEGFTQFKKGKTLEEVAEEYLTGLIKRSLVQVVEVDIDGKAKYCQIHDLLREVIIKKMEELNFCHLYEDNDKSSIDHEIIRRLSVSTNSNDFLCKVKNSHTRSIYIFRAEELSEPFWSKLLVRFKLLRVLHLQHASLTHVPNKLGNFLHLRYINLIGTKVQDLPRTIGKLQNLETLDLRQTLVREIPREINKLRKLQHLMVFHRDYNVDFNASWNWETGVTMEDKNIGSMTSLQTLHLVEVDHGGVDLIEELQKLRQLRCLRLNNVRREYGNALCALINEMKHPRCLHLCAITADEMMDLHSVSSPPQLQELYLKGQLERLPDWIPRLNYLVKLFLLYSKLTDDPLKLLKGLPNLLYLVISNAAYEGESLHFEEGGFQKLKRLRLEDLSGLNSILIDKGALHDLEQFEFTGLPQLTEVPSGIRHLEHLRVLDIFEMPHEFNQSIDSDVGHWVIQHVPIIHIRQKTGPGYFDYESRTIRSTSSAEKIDGEAFDAN